MDVLMGVLHVLVDWAPMLMLIGAFVYLERSRDRRRSDERALQRLNKELEKRVDEIVKREQNILTLTGRMISARNQLEATMRQAKQDDRMDADWLDALMAEAQRRGDTNA